MKYLLGLVLLGTSFVLSLSPASAWWQFVANGPNSERQVSPRFRHRKGVQKPL